MIHYGRKNMYQNQVQNKPTAAYIISLLGGIFGLLASLAFMAIGALAYSALNSYAYGDSVDLGLGWGWTLYIGFGV